MSKKLDEILKKLKQIEDSKVRKVFEDMVNNTEDLDTALARVNNAIEEQDRGLESIASRYTEIVNESSKANKNQQQLNKHVDDLVGLSRTLADIKTGETNTSNRQLTSLSAQLTAKKNILQKQLEITKKGSEEAKAIAQVMRSLEKEAKQIEAIKENYKEVNKEIGLGPQILGGMDKALGKLGFPDLGINKALEDTQKMGMAAKNAGVKFDAMGTFVVNMAKQLKNALSFANLFQMAITQTFKAIQAGDKSIGKMAKDMNITYQDAAALRTEMTGIAKESGDPALNTERLQNSMMAVNNLMGARVSLGKEDLKTFTKLREQAGFTNEELFGMQQLATLNNKSLKDTNKELTGNIKAFAAQNKLAINEKVILRDIVKASSSLQLSLGGSTEQLAKAAINARKFGISLEQSEKMAESLLDFESSITKELEAEILTGKNLNFERARGLALEGKTAEAAAEMLKQMGGSAEFAKMNVIQQKAMAEAAGMTREEFAKSIKDREVLEKLGAKEGQSQLEAYNAMRKAGMTREQIATKLGDKELENQLNQQSNQEKFQQSVMKMQEAFTELANKLMPVFTMLAEIGEVLIPAISLALFPVQMAIDGIKMMFDGFTALLNGEALSGLQTFSVIAGTIAGIFSAIHFTKKLINLELVKGQTIQARGLLLTMKDLGGAIANGVAKIFGSFAAIPFGLGIPLAIAAVAGMIGLAYSKMKDGVIGPGGETVVSGPKGSIQLDKEDSMIVGTDLGGKKKPKKQTSPSTSISMAETNAKLDAILAAIEKGSIIEINGDKMGETINQGTRAIQ